MGCMNAPRRWLAAITVIFAASAGLAITTFPALAATCTTSSPTGSCGPYNDSNVFTSTNGNDLVVQNDFQSISQTLTATDSTQWSVTANTTGLSDQTSVKSYPATQVTYTTTSDKPEPSADFGSTLTSGFINTIPSGSGQDYEYAFDDWLANPNQQSWTGPDTEVMIWTYVNGQVPFGSDTGKVYTDAAGTQWELWTGGGASSVSPHSTLSLVRKTNATSGSIDRIGFYKWLQGQGELSSTYGIDQLNYGLEICSTGGAAKTYGISGYSIVPNGTGGGGGAQAPAVSTSPATGITASGATLNGTVNPEGQATTYKFDYGTSLPYGSSTSSASAGSGTSAVSESAAIGSLAASTTYHFRIEATNATGTTFGTDQTFTTSSSGGGGSGAVAFDSASSAHATGSGSLTWTHTVGSGTDRALVVGLAVGIQGDSGCSASVTDNGTFMSVKSVIHANGQSSGYLEIFSIYSPPSGANTLAASVSGCSGGTPDSLIGGGQSFANVAQGGNNGITPVNTATGSGSVSQVSIAGAANDLAAGFVANGSPVLSAASPNTSRYIVNVDNNTAAGNSAAATNASSTTAILKWNQSADWWAAGVVRVQHD